ncbi:MAG: response regulator [Cellvibrionaceae bacterium]
MVTERRKLLIIDDDTFVRQGIVAYLEDSGYEVESAASGPDGLTLCQSFQPELVLSDLMMPNMGGMEVLKKINEINPDTPVIVISGVGVMDDVVSALRLGAIDYLIKPIADMEVLEHAVRKGLAHRDLIFENRRYREELEEKNAELSHNLKIIERDQQAGREVQERLLPPSPIAKGEYTISRHMNPSLYLSGDFIDYAYFLDRYLGFYLTDVAGHGASSAFVTIWLKYLVRNLMRDTSIFKDSTEDYVFTKGPNLLLQAVNRELIATRLNNHLTSFQGTVDIIDHKLRYSVGGHLPLPILLTDDGAKYVEGKGKPIGIFKDVEWDVFEVELPKKFTLLVFSDGILEIIPGDDLEDKERQLLAWVSQMKADMNNNSMTMESVCNALGIDNHDDNPDDIAVLMLKRGH